jgi:hypothetical protein
LGFGLAESGAIYDAGRGGHTHHGIDVGWGFAIDFTGRRWRQAPIDGPACAHPGLLRGAGAQSRAYGSCLDPEEAVARAESLLGNGQYEYDLLANNCEHLATWCVAGEHSSAQVGSTTSALDGLGLLYALPIVGLTIVREAGEAGLRSGPNLGVGAREHRRRGGGVICPGWWLGIPDRRSHVCRATGQADAHRL